MLTKTYKEFLEMPSPKPKARVVSHLAELMKVRKLSVRQVVDGTGLADATVRRWFKDRIGRVDPVAAMRLSAFLDCKQEDLYTIVEE